MKDKIEKGVQNVLIKKHKINGILNESEDFVGVETPVQLRIKSQNQNVYENLAVLMCSPFNEKELVVGFLYNEGFIECQHDIIEISDLKDRIIQVMLKSLSVSKLKEKTRKTISTSSCGICSSSNLNSLETESPYLPWTSICKIPASMVYKIQQDNFKESHVFNCTGSVHSSTLYQPDGKMIVQFEDVGRHNALDKIVGHAILNNTLPLSKTILLLSGRISFELVQKSAMAGIPIIVARGAPTSLAIEEAIAQNICLIGFAKDHAFNIYSAHERIIS